MTAARSPISTDPQYQAFLSSFKGQVIWPGDETYDALRAAHIGGIDRRPALIACPLDAQDVSQIVRLARASGLELAVRSGGHSGAAHSTTEGGILMDLCNLRDLHIDPAQRTLWAGTGLRAGDIVTALAEHDLALPLGDTASVGIGGITLGGGIGYLVRKHGLTIDDLLGAEVVTADGECLQVDADTHPDLYWAIRGGGGNFGVATRFLFRVHPLGQVYGGMIVLPAAPETLAGFIRLAQEAPEELSAIVNVMPAPPMPFLPESAHGKLIIMAMMVYSGDPQEGEQVFAPFRALAAAYADMLRPMRYPEIYLPEQAGEGAPPCLSMRNLYMDSVDEQSAAVILGGLRLPIGAIMQAAQLRVLGGAMARIPVESTAFPHRASHILVQLVSMYPDSSAAPAHETWAEDLANALRQEDTGRYVNFLGPVSEEDVRAAYGHGAWERLRLIKKRYDPENLFRMNQNIPPM